MTFTLQSQHAIQDGLKRQLAVMLITMIGKQIGTKVGLPQRRA